EEIFLNELNRIPTDNEYKLLKEEFVQQLKIEKDRDPSQFLEVNGAKDFIKLLNEMDHPLGIATGGWEASARLKLDAVDIGVKDLGFSNSSRYKTRHGIINDVMNQLTAGDKIDPNEIIYFGDGMWDMITCRKMGIHFIGIDYDGDQILKGAGVIPVFKDFSNKDAIMDIINNGGIGIGKINLDF
ncbi:MAG: HAD hydrolase-like protein, partial [Saprospiraceae bacterium]|nr:HAD hydrolase-like protein [Saprospiraceae bacterium]